MNHKQIIIALCLFATFTVSGLAQPLKAGLARVAITPAQPIHLAGYAARNTPVSDKLHDIWAKAVAIQDASGQRVVIVTTDLLGFSKEIADAVTTQAQAQFGLKREQVLLTSSHTHAAPIVRANLIGAYDLDPASAARVVEYGQQLQTKIVEVIGAALRNLQPAKLALVHGQGSFAVNRRARNAAGAINIGVNQQGVVDHDVPVLMIESLAGKLRGVLFSYACHNTTLTDKNLAISGDYAGFAQAEFEKAHPGAMALFAMGCGADINPNPRSTVELAKQHGAALAAAVHKALTTKRQPVTGKLQLAFDQIMLAYGKVPSRQEWEAELLDKNAFKQRRAQRMLGRLDRDGQLASEYGYPIQTIQIGASFTLIALAGEVVTDYALRLKRELGERGLWVMGYANEVMAYIPSERMYQEGGYEVVDSMIYYDHPSPWSPALEDAIIAKVHEQVTRLGRKK